MTGTTKTRGGVKRAPKGRGSPAKRLRDDGVLRLDRTQRCYLLCFDPALQEELPWAGVLSLLSRARLISAERPPWVVYAGTSPMHWQGLTHWLLVSEGVPPNVYEMLCEGLRAGEVLGEFECNEMTSPAAEAFMRPLFSLEDDGAKLLMEPEFVDPAWSGGLAGVPLRQRGWAWRDAAGR